jgi:hypothetical protein
MTRAAVVPVYGLTEVSVSACFLYVYVSGGSDLNIFTLQLTPPTRGLSVSRVLLVCGQCVGYRCAAATMTRAAVVPVYGLTEVSVSTCFLYVYVSGGSDLNIFTLQLTPRDCLAHCSVPLPRRCRDGAGSKPQHCQYWCGRLCVAGTARTSLLDIVAAAYSCGKRAWSW